MNDRAIRRALYGKLAGDTTLHNLLATPPSDWPHSIYWQEAPEGADYPYVIFQKQSGVPVWAMGGRTMDRHLWLVKGVDRQPFGDQDPVDDVAERIDALLNDASLSLSGAALLYLRRDGDVSYGEPSGDHRVLHAGATYRLIFD